MSDVMGAANTLGALLRIDDQMLQYLGEEERQSVVEQIQSVAKDILLSTDPNDWWKKSIRILSIFDKYPEALKRLQKEIDVNSDVTEQIGDNLEHLASKLGLSHQVTLQSLVTAFCLLDVDADVGEEKPSVRRVTIDLHQGIKAKTTKFRNILIHPKRLLRLGAGSALHGHAIMEAAHPDPLLIAAAALYVLWEFASHRTIQLTDVEASVFWGLIQSSGRGYVSKESDIRPAANKERTRVGLGPITEQQVTDALSALKELRVIAPVEGNTGQWRVVEEFEIRG